MELWNWEEALKTAILMGISLTEFDYMTPHELAVYAEAFLERRTAEFEEKVTLVWLHEYYHRQKYLPSLKDEIKKRWDFRETLTFTIDPEDAKDFDDAISFKRLDNGHYEIGVHIADVTHYVKPGTILDADAFDRATSVYLVDRTVPMLPEKLSNGL